MVYTYAAFLLRCIALQEEKSVVTCSDDTRHNLDNALEDVYVTFKEVEVGYLGEGRREDAPLP